MKKFSSSKALIRWIGFLVLTLFIASQFTYVNFFAGILPFPPYGINEISVETPLSFIYQKDDNELILRVKDNSLYSNIFEIQQKLLKMSTNNVAVLGLPLDWIKHTTCFDFSTEFTSTGGILVGNPIPLSINFSDNREQVILRQSQCFTSGIRDINIFATFEYLDEFKKGNAEKIQKFCTEDQKNKNDCIVDAKIKITARSFLSDIASWVAILILSSSLAIIFLTAIVPLIWKFVFFGIAKNIKS